MIALIQCFFMGEQKMMTQVPSRVAATECGMCKITLTSMATNDPVDMCTFRKICNRDGTYSNVKIEDCGQKTCRYSMNYTAGR